MKRSDVNVANLLNQLSEEKINLVVNHDAVCAEGSSDCSAEGSENSESNDSEAEGGIGVTIGVGGSIGIGL